MSYQQVETPEQAEHVGFRGSPTVLIDGVDSFGTTEASPGLACRVYITDRGTQPAPTVEQLRAALVR